jgi:hypothetical protein
VLTTPTITAAPTTAAPVVAGSVPAPLTIAPLTSASAPTPVSVAPVTPVAAPAVLTTPTITPVVSPVVAPVAPVAQVTQVAAPAVPSVTPVVATSVVSTPVAIASGVTPTALTTLAAPMVAAVTTVPTQVDLPTGFYLEEGAADQIAVGSKNGEIFAVALGHDGQLYFYDTYSMNQLPWIKQTAVDGSNNPITTFKSVSCSSDGVLCAVSDLGNAYVYYWATQQWQAIPGGADNEDVTFDMISVGNVNNIWAVNLASNSVYQLMTNGWQKRADGVCSYVTAGFDGTVVAINTVNDVFKFNTTNQGWDRLLGTKLTQVAVGNSNFIYGIDNQNQLWQFTNNVWSQVKGADGNNATGLSEISMNAAGTVFAIDIADNIYLNGEEGLAVSSVPSAAVPTATTPVGQLKADNVLPVKASPKKKITTHLSAKKVGRVMTPKKKVVRRTTRVKPKASKPTLKQPTSTRQRKASKASVNKLKQSKPANKNVAVVEKPGWMIDMSRA